MRIFKNPNIFNTTMKGIYLIFILLLFLLLACSKSEIKEFKIGVIAPLTGPNAWIGEFLIPSIDLAVEDINSKGGIKRMKIKTIIEDADTSAKASTAANKLISVDNVDVLYPITTPVVAPASAIAEQNKVPTFTFTSVNAFAKKNTWVFTDLRDIVQECSSLAKAALKNNHKKIAVLGNDADFTLECLDTLNKEFVPNGGQVIAKEIKLSNNPDARTPLLKLKESKPEAMFIICWPPDCNLIYKQMIELGFTPQLYIPIGFPLGINPLSLKDMDKDLLLKNAFASDTALNQDDPTPELAKFKDKLVKKIGKEPRQVVDAAVAYDDIHEIAIAASKCKDLTNECIRSNLEQTDYTGVAGNVKFDGKHYAARASRVIQYKDGKWVTFPL